MQRMALHRLFTIAAVLCVMNAVSLPQGNHGNQKMAANKDSATQQLPIQSENGSHYVDCLDARLRGHTQSGLYIINPRPSTQDPFPIHCDMEADGGGWTVFHHSYTNATTSHQTWDDYVNGYTDRAGNTWLGLEKLHQLTARHYLTQMRADITDLTEGTAESILFEEFFIDSEAQNYEPVIRRIRTDDDNNDGTSEGKDDDATDHDNDDDDDDDDNGNDDDDNDDNNDDDDDEYWQGNSNHNANLEADELDALLLWEIPSEDDQTNCQMKNVGRWWFRDCEAQEEEIDNAGSSQDNRKSIKLVQMKLRAVL